jgi:uncharacterized protein
MRYKILFAGPVGAGKTTAIASVSDTEVVQTDVRASDEVIERKDRTTVAMDYGTLDIDSGLTIQLVGTPGQERFDFMWEILAKGALGVLLLLDNARPDPMADLEVYLGAFHRLVERNGGRGVVGITRRDLCARLSLADYRAAIAERGLRWPVFELDARSRQDVKVALMALAAELNPHPHRRRAA